MAKSDLQQARGAIWDDPHFLVGLNFLVAQALFAILFPNYRLVTLLCPVMELRPGTGPKR